MNDIFKKFNRIKYVMADGSKVQVPSDTLLKELILFPNFVGYPHSTDPFNVNRYRIRPQYIDPESQSLLVAESNTVVWSIIGKYLEGTQNNNEQHIAVLEYCQKHNYHADSIFHAFNLCEYVQRLLPGANADPDKSSKLITEFASMKPNPNKVSGFTYDLIEAAEKAASRSKRGSEILNYFNRLYLSMESNERRFSEFKAAMKYLEEFSSKPSCNEIQYIFTDGMYEINRTNERNSKQATKNRRNLTIGVTSDTSILTQCLFCNRFHKQDLKGEGNRKLSRSCDRVECKKVKQNWEDSLKISRKGMSMKNVSPSGF